MTAPAPRARGLLAFAERALDLEVSDDDLRGFDSYARLASLRHGVMLCVAFGLGALLMWPTDALFFPERPDVRVAFGVWRAQLLVLSLLSLGCARWIRRVPALIYPSIAFFGVVLSAAAGRALAATGGPELAWFHTLYVVPLGVFPLSLPLWQRVATTSAVTFSCIGAYFASDPRYLDFDGFPTVIVAVVGTALVATLIGHSHFRLLRTTHAQRLQLALKADELERKVAARTRRLRQLTDHLERSREQERLRIGRDLHDELAQLLTAMRLELELAKRGASAGVVKFASVLDNIVTQMFAAKERIVRALQPAELDELGLADAIRVSVAEVRRRCETAVEISVEVVPPEPHDDVALAVYRLLHEALANAVRHAGADRIAVDLVSRDDVVRVVVSDDGCGFDPLQIEEGRFGLLGAQERIAALGGELSIESKVGEGTRFEFALPVQGRHRGGADGGSTLGETTLP